MVDWMGKKPVEMMVEMKALTKDEMLVGMLVEL